LKIETKPRDDHQVSLSVELDKEQLEGAKHRAARKISERKSIPGFRPGKAPYDVVIRSYGEEAVTQEAVDILLDEVYPKALEESKLKPGAAGLLEKVDGLDKKPVFSFIVPLAPTVDLGDYRSIRFPYEWKEPTSKKVDEALEELRQMYAKTETVERPIEKGDFVMIDLKGVDENAKEGDAPLIDQPGLPVFIRPDKKEGEYPYVGFSNQLVGLNTGESKSFSNKFDDANRDDTLKGKKVRFDITVKLVRGSTLPDLDDDLAKKAGPFANIAALRDAVRANLSAQSKVDYDDEYYEKVIEAIKKGAKIKYPPQVVDHEVEHVMEDLKSRLAEQGLDLPAYLKTRQQDEKTFIENEAKPTAIKRLERSLILDEIMNSEKIDIGEEEINSSFRETYNQYQGNPGFQKLLRGKSQPPKKIMNAIAMESANRAYIQKTLNRLKEIATGKEKPQTKEKSATSKAAKKTTGATSSKKTPAVGKKIKKVSSDMVKK
jgi:trigger factor